jgi:hypothetical protein
MIGIISALGQSKLETHITILENQEKEAVIKGDTLVLYKLWSPNYVTNGSSNSIITIKNMKDYYRIGKIDHSYFDRNIEKITITKHVVFVMGNEVKILEKTGKTQTRRFTNIWMKNNGEWLLTARQATIISTE